VKELEKIIAEAETASGVRIHESAKLPTSALVFQPELLKACESNVCGKYNKSWTCPPACAGMEEQRKKILAYKNAYVFTTKHELEDSFDYEGMTRGRIKHTSLLLEINNRITEHPVYGAGTCPICKDNTGNESCAFPDPCPFPEKRIGSIEAAGINVTELSIAAGIRYNNGQNTVTYFSIILQK
jgi:predicted metal-binding protein